MNGTKIEKCDSICTDASLGKWIFYQALLQWKTKCYLQCGAQWHITCYKAIFSVANQHPVS